MVNISINCKKTSYYANILFNVLTPLVENKEKRTYGEHYAFYTSKVMQKRNLGNVRVFSAIYLKNYWFYENFI